MRVKRFVAVGAVAGLAMAGAVGCTQEVSLAVPLDCAGEAASITVDATMPGTVPSGSAFALTVTVTGHPGGVALALTNATPAIVGVGADGQPSTTQLVATGAPGSEVSVDVVELRDAVFANDPDDPYDPIFDSVTCTPTGETRLGSVPVGEAAAPGPAATTAVDAHLPMVCTSTYDDQLGQDIMRLSMTVPTRVTPGETFSVPDYTWDAERFGGSLWVEAGGATVAGPGSPYVTAQSAITVTAAAGGQVTIDLPSTTFYSGGFPVGHCVPAFSGRVATIPVVAGPS